MSEFQLSAWLRFFCLFVQGRGGNTEKIMHYNSEQLAAALIKRQSQSCLMTKTDSRLQIWTSWCIPVSNMKDRKYLTCAAFGEQEKIWRSSMALLRLLINLFNSGFFSFVFFFVFFFYPEQCGIACKAVGRSNSLSASCSTLVTAFRERWTHQRSWALLYITQHMQR